MPDTGGGRIAVGVLAGGSAPDRPLDVADSAAPVMIVAIVVVIVLGTVAVGITVAGWEGAAAAQLLSCVLVAIDPRRDPAHAARAEADRTRNGPRRGLHLPPDRAVLRLRVVGGRRDRRRARCSRRRRTRSPHPSGFKDEIYFSFVTLTTIGYGDIVARERPRPGISDLRGAARTAVPRHRRLARRRQPRPRAHRARAYGVTETTLTTCSRSTPSSSSSFWRSSPEALSSSVMSAPPISSPLTNT